MTFSDPTSRTETSGIQPLPQYFPDLDGLRAVAVLTVVGYHAGLPGISGGFTGVDIFFVLSGFFITLQLAKDIKNDRFSIVRFYERRVRRILPAFYFVSLVTFIAASFLMIPNELIGFQKSLLSSIFFAANIFFWQDISYFAQEAATKPLLHFWSLALEEQFYFFFPIALALVSRFGTRVSLLGVAAAAVVSFSCSVVLTPFSPAATFFLLPTRAWELLLGSLVALAPRFQLAPIARHALSLAGLGLIAASLVIIAPDDQFPGWLAILPTSGSTLLILASLSGGGIGNRILALAPMVWVGLISYSLYLWHWPILALARYVTNGELSLATTIACVAASFAMAVLSWRFVERPFRGRDSKFSSRRVVIVGLAGAGILIAAAAAVLGLNGIPQRFSPAAARYLETGKRPGYAQCFDLDPAIAQRNPTCYLGAWDRPTKVVLWGDSHAFRLATNVDRLGQTGGFGALLLTHGSCPPLARVMFARESSGCRAFSDSAFATIATVKPDLVILSARWTSYAGGANDDSPHDFNSLSDDKTISTSSAGNREVFRRSLIRTLEALHSLGIGVLIVGPVPNLNVDARRALVLAAQWGMDPPQGPSLGAFHRRENKVLAVLEEADAFPFVEVYYPHRVLCTARRCAITKDGRSLYMDDNHLNEGGNLLIHPTFAASFRASYEMARDGRRAEQAPQFRPPSN